VDDAAQLIERSEAHIITVTVPKRRRLSIVERFVLRAISLQAQARGRPSGSVDALCSEPTETAGIPGLRVSSSG